MYFLTIECALGLSGFLLSSIAKFCLVLWSKENSVSVLSLERVGEGNEAGDMCKVKIQWTVYEGEILATGKLYFLLLVHENSLVEVHLYASVTARCLCVLCMQQHHVS